MKLPKPLTPTAPPPYQSPEKETVKPVTAPIPQRDILLEVNKLIDPLKVQIIQLRASNTILSDAIHNTRFNPEVHKKCLLITGLGLE